MLSRARGLFIVFYLIIQINTEARVLTLLEGPVCVHYLINKTMISSQGSCIFCISYYRSC
jgi:hypothetical protein